MNAVAPLLKFQQENPFSKQKQWRNYLGIHKNWSENHVGGNKQTNTHNTLQNQNSEGPIVKKKNYIQM